MNLRRYVTGEPLDDGGKALRRKSLVFELNRSGKYHAMKDRLKDAAQVIIKERFHAGGEGVQAGWLLRGNGGYLLKGGMEV